MSLRYIPNITKLSPLQMFLKSAKDEENKHHRKMDKKLRSLEYIMYMKQALGYFFTDNTVLNNYLEQFEIENKKIKKNLEKLKEDNFNRYFVNDQFNKVRFEQDFENILNRLVQRFEETAPLQIAVKIIDKHEILNGELVTPDICENVNEYRERLKERQEEMQYLFMYLAKASTSELKEITTKRPNSELVQTIMEQDIYRQIRNSYSHDMQQAIRKDKKPNRKLA